MRRILDEIKSVEEKLTELKHAKEQLEKCKAFTTNTTLGEVQATIKDVKPFVVAIVFPDGGMSIKSFDVIKSGTSLLDVRLDRKTAAEV